MCLGSMFTECNSGKEYTICIRICLKVTSPFPFVLLASVMETEKSMGDFCSLALWHGGPKGFK